jgi:hypothetical protein
MPDKILPVSAPMIALYTHHAHPLSILANYEKSVYWIIANYTNVYINKDYLHEWGDFYFQAPYDCRPAELCPFLHTQKILRDRIPSKKGAFIDFLIECLDRGEYVDAMVDFFHLPMTNDYQKRHWLHDVLVSAYSTERRTFVIADFFKDGLYKKHEISFEDMDSAFLSYHEAMKDDFLKGMLVLYSIRRGVSEDFNASSMIRQMEAYLSAKPLEFWDLFKRDNMPKIDFGIDAYRTISHYLRNCAAGPTIYPVDIRPFSLLQAQKKIMLERIKAFMNADESIRLKLEGLLASYATQCSDYDTLILMLIKYNMTLNIGIVPVIQQRLEAIAESEKRFYGDFIDAAATFPMEFYSNFKVTICE